MRSVWDKCWIDGSYYLTVLLNVPLFFFVLFIKSNLPNSLLITLIFKYNFCFPVLSFVLVIGHLFQLSTLLILNYNSFNKLIILSFKVSRSLVAMPMMSSSKFTKDFLKSQGSYNNISSLSAQAFPNVPKITLGVHYICYQSRLYWALCDFFFFCIVIDSLLALFS